jgi:hypothetical protein
MFPFILVISRREKKPHFKTTNSDILSAVCHFLCAEPHKERGIWMALCRNCRSDVSWSLDGLPALPLLSLSVGLHCIEHILGEGIS